MIKLILQSLAKKRTKLEHCFRGSSKYFRIEPKCCLIRMQARMSCFDSRPRGMLGNIYCLILQIDVYITYLLAFSY